MKIDSLLDQLISLPESSVSERTTPPDPKKMAMLRERNAPSDFVRYCERIGSGKLESIQDGEPTFFEFQSVEYLLPIDALYLIHGQPHPALEEIYSFSEGAFNDCFSIDLNVGSKHFGKIFLGETDPDTDGEGGRYIAPNFTHWLEVVLGEDLPDRWEQDFGLLSWDDVDDAWFENDDDKDEEEETTPEPKSEGPAILSSADEEPPEPETGKTWVNSLGIEFIGIEAGTFVQGDPPFPGSTSDPESDWYDKDDEPPRQVTISSPFWLARFLCTEGLYESITGKTLRQFTGDPEVAADKITPNEADTFCKMLNKQLGMKSRKGWGYGLPTIAEWEYAAKLGTDGQHIAGDQIDAVAWTARNASGPQKVGLKEPHPLGFYDLFGNVSEICIDGWKQPNWSTTKAVSDPGLKCRSKNRAVKGGSYFGLPERITFLTPVVIGFGPERNEVKVGKGFRLGIFNRP